MKKRVNDGYTFAAVSYGEGSTTTNFEQSDHFWMFCLKDGKVWKKELLSFFPKNNEERITAFENAVIDVMICRNFGPKSMAALKKKRISLYTYDGGCNAAVRDLLAGELHEL